MAVPRLADVLPFYLLDPAALTVPPNEAASSTVAASVARKVGVEEMPPVDLIVCGSVAVNEPHSFPTRRSSDLPDRDPG